MDKRFWGIILVIIIIFGGLIYFNNKNSDSGNSNAQPTNHVMGENSKNITLLEYGDYQCPACGSFYPIVKQVVEKYKGDIKFQFRNLPLTQIHPNAFAGARAAEAAALQNKFWEMHDLLYEQQTTWSESSNPKDYFNQYAEQLGLNVEQFKTDFASSKVNGAINADLAAFNKTGAAMQTPTFFLDGKRIDPKADANEFTTILDAAIKAKQEDKQ